MPQVNAKGAKNQCQLQEATIPISHIDCDIVFLRVSAEIQITQFKLPCSNYLILPSKQFPSPRAEGHVTVARFGRPRQFESGLRECVSTGGVVG